MEQTARTQDAWAFGALMLFVVAMYAVPGEWIPGADKLRIALVTSSLAAALVVLRRLGKLEPVYLDGVRGLALIGFAALASGSILWSIHPEESRTTAIGIVKLVAIYLTMVNVLTTWRRVVWVCGALVAGSIVTSIGVIHWHHAGVDLVEGYRARWVGVYADPNHMAMDLGLVVPLALAFLARRQTPAVFRVVSALAAALAVVAIVLSHSRGGFIGLAVAVVLWAAREKQRVRSFFIGLAFVLALLAFAPESFWRRTSTVATFEDDVSALGRVHAWQVAKDINVERPLLGVGAGAFRFAWPMYAPPEARRAYVAHNVFLDVIGELGLVGLFLFLVFAGGASGGAFAASTDPTHGWLARAIAAAIAGYLVCDLFSGYILSSHLYVFFGLGACVDRLAHAVRACASWPSANATEASLARG
ncbi:MAG: O-antigen ligase family protein [Myxococcota bacterium]